MQFLPKNQFHITLQCHQHMLYHNSSLQAAALYAVKINALYTLLAQLNVALNCFTVQLQRMFKKDFLFLNTQKFVEI